MSEEEKAQLRPLFVSKAAWKRYIKTMLQTEEYLTARMTEPFDFLEAVHQDIEPFPRREPLALGDDFLASSLCFAGTARRRNMRRERKAS